MFSLKRLLVALTALVLIGLGSVPALAESTGNQRASWTVHTALSKYGSGRPEFSYTVKAGQKIRDAIDISNEGPRELTLRVYAADGFTTDSGRFDILTPGQSSTGIGAWVKPARTRVTIPAGKQIQIPFTMTVPKNATPGDHVGGIATVLDQRDRSGTVIHRRVGLRIKTRVSGEVRPHLQIEHLDLDHDTDNPVGTGRATLRYTVRNTGNVVLGGLQKARVGGGLGLSPRTVKLARLPDLLPGESWEAKASVDDVRAVPWLSGEVTVTPVLTDAAGSTSTLEPVRASSRAIGSIWPSAILLGLLAVVLGWFLFVAVQRLRAPAGQ